MAAPPALPSSLVLAAPVQKVPVVRAAAPEMMIQETEAAVTALAAASTLIATSAGDFGGYTIPIIGLTTLGATIFLLAGPVED